MTMRKSAPLPAILPKGRRLLENDAARQSDLFSEPSRTQMPAWRDLPEEVRRALTGLMTDWADDEADPGAHAGGQRRREQGGRP